MAPEIPDPQKLIEAYGSDAIVVAGRGMEMTLGQALEMERLLCPADTLEREDPVKRAGYLANMLAAGGSLKPEDYHLLGEAE